MVSLIILFTAFAGCLDEWDWDEDKRETETFNYYTASAPRTLDPAVAYDDVSLNIINNLYERLVTYQSETGSNLVPQIAKSKVTENDASYIFHMRDDIKFSSGGIVDAEDVQYSIARVLKMAQPPSWMLRQVLNESGIILGDFNLDGIRDVKFQLEKPYSGFPHILAFSVCSIVDKEEVEAHGGVIVGQKDDWMAHNSAGSGPFKVTAWEESENQVVLKRNGNYHAGWSGNHLKEIRFKVEESETIRLDVIKSDKADMADIPISLISNLSDETSVRTDIKDTMSVVFLGFNTEQAPFDNLDVRKAFSFAFNYNSMINQILEGRYGDRLHGPIPEGVLGYENNLDNRFYFDPGNAVDHFRAAGYTIQDNKVTDFEDLTFYIPSNASVMGRIMNQLRDNLADLGINVDLQYIDINTYNTGLERGDFPVFLAGWSADFADPDDFVYPLLHSESANLSISNLARYINGSVDELIEEGKETLSPSARTVIYTDIQNSVNGDVPYIWLYQPKAVSVLKSDISGFNWHPILGTNFYEINIVA
jgi:peptide/nickel transport system substrate-binding protein